MGIVNYDGIGFDKKRTMFSTGRNIIIHWPEIHWASEKVFCVAN